MASPGILPRWNSITTNPPLNTEGEALGETHPALHHPHSVKTPELSDFTSQPAACRVMPQR